MLACCRQQCLIISLRVQHENPRSGARAAGEHIHHTQAQATPDVQSITAESVEGGLEHRLGGDATARQAPHEHLPILCTSCLGGQGACVIRDSVTSALSSTSVGAQVSASAADPPSRGWLRKCCTSASSIPMRAKASSSACRRLALGLQRKATCALLVARQRPRKAFTLDGKAFVKVGKTLLRHKRRADGQGRRGGGSRGGGCGTR